MCFHRRHNVTPVSLSTKLTLVKMAGLYYLGYQSAVRSPQILIYTAVPGWNKLFGMISFNSWKEWPFCGLALSVSKRLLKV